MEARVLSAPFQTLQEWAAYFAGLDIPVLRRTAKELRGLREREETIAASELADVLFADPLATTRLFAHLARLRGDREGTEITSLEGCIVMLGVPPLFEFFETATIVEEQVGRRADGLRGLAAVTRRARRAARFAWHFGVWRHDPDVGEIAIAALLHDIAETLIWTFAPDLALKIKAMQRADPALRSRTAQRMVLNIDVQELQLVLARQWQLPELFITMMDQRHAGNTRVRNALCAVNLARHLATGWSNAALPDDFTLIGELLNTNAEHAREMVVKLTS